MISRIIDVTEAFDVNGEATLDVSAWQNVSVQLVNIEGTIAFEGSNNSNAITGVSDGSATSADDFTPIAVASIATPTTYVTEITEGGIYILNPVDSMKCKFVRISGDDVGADKVIFFLSKPY